MKKILVSDSSDPKKEPFNIKKNRDNLFSINKDSVKFNKYNNYKEKEISKEIPQKNEFEDFRLNKRLSELGIASRRESEILIQEGAIRVNGKIVEDPGIKITDKDEIFVKNKKIINKVPKPELYLMHKPAGYITSTVDEKGRKTIFELIPKSLNRLITVGRLDYNTEGLLLLTNNGELARYLELPSTQIRRTYYVQVFGYIDNKKLERLRKGLTVDGIKYQGFFVEILKIGEPYSSLEITITEGKNREIRKVMEHLGLKVVKLIRTHYGPYKLRTIPYGTVVKAPFVVEFK